jgi:hypothetical protein
MTNNKQQTAVEWLFNQMFDPTYPAGEQMEWLEEAKEMEQNQIIDAHLCGQNSNEELDGQTEIDYYNKTYGGGEQ